MFGESIECIDHVLFDTVRLSAHTEFFDKPVGHNGKTREETNLWLSRTLPASQSFVLEAIWFTCPDGEYPQKMLRGGFVSFQIAAKEYWTRAPLGVCFAPSYVVDIMPRNIETPFLIRHEHAFLLSVSWLVPTHVRPLKLQARMRGKLYRPVN